MLTQRFYPMATVVSWMLLFLAGVASAATLLGLVAMAKFSNSMPPEQLMAQALISLTYALIAVLLFLLGKVVSSSKGDPFTRTNARRLMLMGWFATFWQLCELVLSFSGQNVNLVSVPGLRLRLAEPETISVGGLLTVLILFALAHVFRHGAEMREELEGTV